MPIPWAKTGKAIGGAGAVVGAVQGTVSLAGKMNASRRTHKNLSELFREHFLTQDGLLREDVVEVECAGLTFTREVMPRKEWFGSEYYSVRAVNNNKTGDNPERVYRFGYFPNSKKVGWPPIYTEWY